MKPKEKEELRRRESTTRILSDLLKVTSHPLFAVGQILNMEPLVIRGRVLMLSQLISYKIMDKTLYSNTTERKIFKILSFNLPLNTLLFPFFRVYRAL